jgi:hypothetical protein
MANVMPFLNKVKSTIWKDAPELAIPYIPAILADSENLWLGYETNKEPVGNYYAVIKFIDVFDHRLSPINDEGLREHPYYTAGLQFYSFNELTGSRECEKWKVLGARHWVITFKDNTLDIIGTSAELVANNIVAQNPVSAIQNTVLMNYEGA